MSNISEYSVNHRSIVWFFLAVSVIGGIYSFFTLGKREDSTFTIKSAIVTCQYSGATPSEVEQLVTIPLERELRTLSSVDEITSESYYGYATLTVKLQPATPADRVPQLWDELRRKVANVEPSLPDGAGPLVVVDDFGDVYGIYFAMLSDSGYTWDELRSYAREVETQLYSVSGVEKVMLYGEQQPEIDIIISPSTLAAFDLRPNSIADAIAGQSAVVGLGVRRAGDLIIRLSEGTTYSSIEDIENQLLTAADGKQYRLGDVVNIERRYKEPASVRLRVDGRDAIGIAVSVDDSRDIVTVGSEVDRVITSLRGGLPAGVEIVSIYSENEIARDANYDFLTNLAESLVIVILLIMLTMGWRAGVVVGSSLIFCIGATLLGMLFVDETLNRTSLAGFIIAMGMLVDNAIVVTDNTIGYASGGMSMRRAAVAGATIPRMGLLAATLIAIISFLPLQLAPSSVAEIVRPLFMVIAMSLLISWVLALTQVPAMGVSLLRVAGGVSRSQRSTWFKNVVEHLLRHRITTLCGVVAIFVLALWIMSRMPQNFFPQLSKPYFRADVHLPEGYDIEATNKNLNAMTEWLVQQPEVKRVSTTAGATPPRYYLASSSYANRANYGNVLVELYDRRYTSDVEQRFDKWVSSNLADVWLRSSLFKLSPVPDATIEFGFIGDNVDTLRALAWRAMQIINQLSDVRNVRNSWGNRVAVWQPDYSQVKGQRIGVDRRSMMRSLEISTSGYSVGVYRDQELQLPILLRTAIVADSALTALETMPVFSAAGRVYSVEQATSGFDFGFRLPVVKRLNSERVIKAQCDPKRGVNTILLQRELQRTLEQNMTLPEGYRMEIFGEAESRDESNGAIASMLPLTLLLIAVILLLLEQNYCDPIVVMLTIPLIFIGVVFGLGVSGKMFDFFSLLGMLGLIGMNVKSAVILISRISEIRSTGMSGVEAIARASADRFVPVVTASGTTVLGMVPLLFDSMFGSMAATIMGGLIVATVLVLLVLPVLYSVFHNIKN